MSVLMTPPYLEFADADGNPLSGGKIWTYAAGTVNPKSTFTDSTETVQLPNPIILDAAGRAVIWIRGSYKFVVTDSNDNIIRTVDNVTSFNATASASDSYFQSFSGNGSQTVFTLSEDLGTDENSVMVFIDRGGASSVTNVPFFQTFTAVAAQTVYTLSQDLGTDENAVMVFVNTTTKGYEVLKPTQFTISGTTLTLTTAPTVTGADAVFIFKNPVLSGTLSKGFEIQNPNTYTLSGTSLTFVGAPATGTNNIMVFAPSTLVGAAASSAAAAEAFANQAQVSAEIATNAAASVVLLVTPFQAPYNAVGDGVADDTVALQAWLNSGSGTIATEGPANTLWCPAGYKFKTTNTLTINKPVNLEMGSFIYFEPATPATANKPAILVNQTNPTTRNMGFNMYFAGLVQTNGNLGTVTSINATGCTGIEVRNMQFSTLKVDNIRQFTKNAVYLNGSNDAYANQHVQDNTIHLGLGAFNGRGLYINSISAALGAVQVNDIYIQNYFANYENLRIDNNNSNNNNFIINAMDAPAPSGLGIICNGSFNSFLVTYLNTDLNFTSSAYSNKFKVTTTPDVSTTLLDNGFFNTIETGNTGVANPCTPAGRLTLVSGTPVQNTTVSGATTIYYTPYNGNFVPLWNGASFDAITFAELSNVSTASAVNKAGPAAVTANSNYDLFVWNDVGTNRLTRGPAWTSDTGRGTGAGTTELELVKGIYVNKNAITNGPAARKGTYVGSFRSDGSSQMNFILGGLGVGGALTICGVWNAYNRIQYQFGVGDTTDSYAYAVNVYRPANNSTLMRINYIQGLLEDNIAAEYGQTMATGATTGFPNIAIGLDSTTAMNGRPAIQQSAPWTGTLVSRMSTRTIGFHYVQAIEKTMDGANVTWFGDGASPASYQNILSLEIKA